MTQHLQIERNRERERERERGWQKNPHWSTQYREEGRVANSDFGPLLCAHTPLPEMSFALSTSKVARAANNMHEGNGWTL